MGKNKIYKIFIDGSAGTTGLRIKDRLRARSDIELISLDEDIRKDANARQEAIEKSDITFLCLPDNAAKETCEMLADSDTVIIDTSTAHRTSEGWTYGFPELGIGTQRKKIKSSKRISNPGCHASGFIALMAPLARFGLIRHEAKFSSFSITGYSGGGKNMITEYEKEGRDLSLDAPRQYGLGQMHKHLAEMKRYSGLYYEPVFCPLVAPFYSGMEVSIPVFAEQINGSKDDIKAVYKAFYNGDIIKYTDDIDDKGFISASKMSGRDDMLISVQGNDDRMVLTALFDNLGKGASGAAIQNMNIVMDVDETAGLVISEEKL